MAALANRLRYPLLSIGGALLVWQAVALTGVFDARVLPGPVEVIVALAGFTVSPFAGATLWGHAAASLLRLLSGFLAAIVLAVPLGIAMARIPTVDAAVAPYFDTLRFIPPLAWVPFAVLWFGIGLPGQALVIFTGVFAALLINTYQGIREVPPVLVDAARTLGAKPTEVLREVIVPAATPLIFAGLRIGLGIGWMSLIGAELIAAQEGLGFVIARAQVSFRSDLLIAGMVAIGIIGAMMDIGLQRLELHLLRWRTS